MHAWAAAIIAIHGFVYFVAGLVLMFRCISNQTIVFIEEQLQVNSKKSDVEADVLENPEPHRLALRFAAYIMVFLGGLRMTIAFNDSCVMVVLLVHTFVSENIMICNELVERGMKGVGWIGCVFVLNAALVGLASVFTWECVQA
jgi:hypothetical protein